MDPRYARGPPGRPVDNQGAHWSAPYHPGSNPPPHAGPPRAHYVPGHGMPGPPQHGGFQGYRPPMGGPPPHGYPRAPHGHGPPPLRGGAPPGPVRAPPRAASPIHGRDPDAPPGSKARVCRSLFLRNIAFEATEKEVLEIFGRYGPLRDYHLIIPGRGIGFIHYYDLRHAQEAFQNTRGINIRNRLLEVEYSFPKQSQQKKTNSENQGLVRITHKSPRDGSLIPPKYVMRLFRTFGELKDFVSASPTLRYAFFFDIRAAEAAVRETNGKNYFRNYPDVEVNTAVVDEELIVKAGTSTMPNAHSIPIPSTHGDRDRDRDRDRKRVRSPSPPYRERDDRRRYEEYRGGYGGSSYREEPISYGAEPPVVRRRYDPSTDSAALAPSGEPDYHQAYDPYSPTLEPARYDDRSRDPRAPPARKADNGQSGSYQWATLGQQVQDTLSVAYPPPEVRPGNRMPDPSPGPQEQQNKQTAEILSPIVAQLAAQNGITDPAQMAALAEQVVQLVTQGNMPLPPAASQASTAAAPPPHYSGQHAQLAQLLQSMPLPRPPPAMMPGPGGMRPMPPSSSGLPYLVGGLAPPPQRANEPANKTDILKQLAAMMNKK